MCANKGNLHAEYKQRVFSRWGVRQPLRCCSAGLLHPMSFTLPKMHELLGQRPKALVRSYFYSTQSKTRAVGLEASLGWRWEDAGDTAWLEEPGEEGRISSCCLGHCGGQLSACHYTFNVANTLNVLTQWIHLSLHHVTLAGSRQWGVWKCGVAPLSAPGGFTAWCPPACIGLR